MRLRSEIAGLVYSTKEGSLIGALKISSTLSCKTGALPKGANVYLVVGLLCSLSLEPKQGGDIEEKYNDSSSQNQRDGEWINHIVNP